MIYSNGKFSNAMYDRLLKAKQAVPYFLSKELYTQQGVYLSGYHCLFLTNRFCQFCLMVQ